MELVEETAHWQEGEMENEWESLALGPGWAPLSEPQAKRRERPGAALWEDRAARGVLCKVPPHQESTGAMG